MIKGKATLLVLRQNLMYQLIARIFEKRDRRTFDNVNNKEYQE